MVCAFSLRCAGGMSAVLRIMRRLLICELPPAAPSPLPSHLHRGNSSRSHPPHFASTALHPCPPPQSSEVRRRCPQPSTRSSKNILPLAVIHIVRQHTVLRARSSSSPILRKLIPPSWSS